MKTLIILSAILAFTTVTSGDEVQDQLRQALSSYFKENLVSVQNAPVPVPPDFSDVQITLTSNINTEEPWDPDLDDPISIAYNDLKNEVEAEIIGEMTNNFTLELVNVTEFRELIGITNIAMAEVDIIFSDVLGDNATDLKFCTSYEEILSGLNGEQQSGSECIDVLVREKQLACNQDICPPTYQCQTVNGDVECQHPCYAEQISNPDFCSGEGQVCLINSTNPDGSFTLDCKCDRNYLDSGGGCVHQNTIIIPCAVVGGVLILAIIITVAVLANRISAKERKEKDDQYMSSGGEFLDETEFDNKAYKSDDGDSGIAGPGKGGNRDEEPVYRDFDDVVIVADNSKQKGSIHSNKNEMNGRPGGRRDSNVRGYPDVRRDQPSVRDYTPLNGRAQKGSRNYEPYDRRDQDRPGYAKPDERRISQAGYDEPQKRSNQYENPPERTNRYQEERTNRYQEDRREPLYSPLNKSESADRNRVLREPDIPDRRYNRENRMYDEPQNRRVSRTAQDESQTYNTGAERGYDRPTRAPGIPERRYSRNEQDYSANRNYSRDNDDIPERGSTRIGTRDTAQELNRDSYRQNWDFNPSSNRGQRY